MRDGAFTTTDLSTGQRKRLALLAAYLDDRPCYLFDEWAADQDPVFKRFFWILVLDVIVLTWAGGATVTPTVVAISQIATAYYFAHFLIILPIVSSIEKPEPLPFSITESVLGKDESAVLNANPAAA